MPGCAVLSDMRKTGFLALASALLGSDGYRVVLALGEVDPSFHPGAALIADAMKWATL
jgi:hypothetical protein